MHPRADPDLAVAPHAPEDERSVPLLQVLLERSHSSWRAEVRLEQPVLPVDLGLHGGEEQHLLDVILVRQELRGERESQMYPSPHSPSPTSTRSTHHAHAVDAEAPAPGRRQSVLHGEAEVLVVVLRLLVTARLGLHLLDEPLPLHDGVVQLRVRVADFLAGDEQLEPLREVRVFAVVLGQRRHDLRVVADERRADKRKRTRE